MISEALEWFRGKCLERKTKRLNFVPALGQRTPSDLGQIIRLPWASASLPDCILLRIKWILLVH